MKATAYISDAYPISETTLSVQFRAKFSSGGDLTADANVSVSPSATAVNNAIKARVVSLATELGVGSLSANDVTVFGGVS